MRRIRGRLTTIILAAQRNSGKSVLCMDLLRELQDDYDLLIGCSETYDGLMNFRGCSPLTVGDELSAELFDDLRVLGFEHLEKTGKQLRIMLTVDDFGSVEAVARSKELARVGSNGRHAGLSLLMTVQRITQAPPGIRENTEIAMFSRSSHEGHRKAVRKEFMAFCDLPVFRRIYESCTKQYSFLVVDTASKELTIEHALCYHRAKVSREPFSFGSPSAGYVQLVLDALVEALMDRDTADAQAASEVQARVVASTGKNMIIC